MVLECFASERHSGLGERRSHDYMVTGLQDYSGCSKVVVPIPNLYLVPLLSMHCVHFKCIRECVSR
jgi:hypothetical protein